MNLRGRILKSATYELVVKIPLSLMQITHILCLPMSVEENQLRRSGLCNAGSGKADTRLILFPMKHLLQPYRDELIYALWPTFPRRLRVRYCSSWCPRKAFDGAILESIDSCFEARYEGEHGFPVSLARI